MEPSSVSLPGILATWETCRHVSLLYRSSPPLTSSPLSFWHNESLQKHPTIFNHLPLQLHYISLPVCTCKTTRHYRLVALFFFLSHEYSAGRCYLSGTVTSRGSEDGKQYCKRVFSLLEKQASIMQCVYLDLLTVKLSPAANCIGICICGWSWWLLANCRPCCAARACW